MDKYDHQSYLGDALNGGHTNVGGIAIGPGSNANGGGDALLGGTTHPGCSIALGVQCFNMPGR